MSEGAGGEGAGADALSILPCLSGALVSVWAGKVLASGIRRPEMSTALVSIVAVVIGATAARVRRAWHGGASTGANLKKRRPFSGSQSLGSALMGVFFASIGATAGSLDALRLAPGLLAFVFLQIAVHTVGECSWRECKPSPPCDLFCTHAIGLASSPQCAWAWVQRHGCPCPPSLSAAMRTWEARRPRQRWPQPG